MTKTISAIPGMKDLLTPEIHLWQRVEEVARAHLKVYNYVEIRTPLLESTPLFERGIGTDTGVVQKEMYSFIDKGGDPVTLRPEGTASVVRAFIEHHLDKADATHKLYYLGPMFRYERPQKGRLRQFHQLGVELLGPSGPMADVEIITLLDQLIRKLNISAFELQINSLGDSVCRPPFEKKMTQYLESIKDTLCSDCQRRVEKNPLRVFDCKNPHCQNLLKSAPTLLEELCTDCKVHFDAVQEGLKETNVAFKINPRIARGLDYYQRTAFEVISNDLGSQNAFAGGGRYDGLIQELGGPQIPGVGFAIGLERLILILPPETEGLKLKKVYMACLGPLAFKMARSIVASLRQAGIICEMEYEEKSLKSQMRRADKLGCSHVLILGEDEVKKNQVVVKDFALKTQQEVSLDELVSFLRN